MTFLHRKLVVRSLKFQKFLEDKLQISIFDLIAFTLFLQYKVCTRNRSRSTFKEGTRGGFKFKPKADKQHVHQILLNVSSSFDV